MEIKRDTVRIESAQGRKYKSSGMKTNGGKMKSER